jgi:transposase
LQVKVIGLDTAKHVFQVHGADKSGRAVLRKRLRRSQVAGFFGNMPECIVGLEATRGAHYSLDATPWQFTQDEIGLLTGRKTRD